MSSRARRASPRRTRPSRFVPTRRPARPRSPGMGELHLEVLVDRMLSASSRSRRTSVGRRSPTARPSRRGEEGRGQASSARPAARASTRSSTSTSSRLRARASTSSTRSRVASVPTEYIPAVQKGVDEALETGVKAGYPMVDVKRHARRRQVPRGRLLGDRLQGRGLARDSRRLPSAPSPCCSSRSSQSRSSRPRSSWVTSSAISTAAAAECRAWRPAATPKS